ncbi:YpdA family putative bacillithiol disulfide reductase [Bacillus sp. WMMC1349]|uniref:YpdA family putative bacillithiol disulfide reductase n=1 Tax=Bacillus sp. WMMC1349 TaxID=2736254 RepID=UPI001553CBF4|nr:YpdA family putative bacillithiol disulfide reductase [Bacillus sp. WMMC1349]NPC92771.1 YpdA family putative bacillithiol disulfide reductase [Bacillus sp. WMMC1349]
MKEEKVIIIGAGPCGLSTAIAMQQMGIDALIIEKGNIVNSIYHYPTHQTFFSSSNKLEIGDVAFITERHKPVRNEALTYYREVAKRKSLRINAFEKVHSVKKTDQNRFLVETSKNTYLASFCIVATGYYDNPNKMNIPGEDLSKVFHYFKEAHPYFDKDVVVIGGKNSSVDAAMELVKAGARVTVLYRGKQYSDSIKPWILPEFVSLVKHGKIHMEFGAIVKEITDDQLIYTNLLNEEIMIKNDFVFAMTGYHPDHGFLKKMGVEIDAESGRPFFNANTLETNVEGIFISGVIVAGNNANEIFIENGRFHGGMIAEELKKRV